MRDKSYGGDVESHSTLPTIPTYISLIKNKIEYIAIKRMQREGRISEKRKEMTTHTPPTRHTHIIL